MTRQLLSFRSASIMLLLSASLIMGLSGCGGAQKASADASASEMPATAYCVVMKKNFKTKADTKVIMYKGKPYYMCCNGCTKLFNANPEKYVGNTPSNSKPKDCTDCKKGDNTANKKDCADCKKGDKTANKKDCADCKKGDKKDCADCKKGDKTANKKDCADCKKGAKTGDAMGTATLPDSAVCVVSGRKFKPTAKTPVAEYKGKKYYMCCGGCAKKFAANPAKYAR